MSLTSRTRRSGWCGGEISSASGRTSARSTCSSSIAAHSIMDFEHYPAQQQPRQQQQWGSHLMQSSHPHHQGQSAFPSPVSPPTTLGDTQFQPYYHSLPQHPQQHQGQPLDRTSSTLSLNLSSLSVASPTNLSPINPSPLHSHGLPHGPHPGHTHSHSASAVNSAMSPITPISPVNANGSLQFASAPQQQQLTASVDPYDDVQNH